MKSLLSYFGQSTSVPIHQLDLVALEELLDLVAFLGLMVQDLNLRVALVE